MPEKFTAAADPLAGGSFSRLLFSDGDIEDAVTVVGVDQNTDVGRGGGGDRDRFRFSVGEKNPPKMLCFGGDCVEDSIVINGASADSTTTADYNTANSSSPSSATNSTTTTSLSSTSNVRPSRKRNLGGGNYYQPVLLQGSLTSGSSAGSTPAPAKSVQRNGKKTRSENAPAAGHAKGKKEKLGERIAALQQLVSPYGKTDTASVLHEAMGYIRFLQEQVQVLCSPYLQGLPSSSSTCLAGNAKGEVNKDLRSRGLCLVPVDGTLHMAGSINGADFWSPAMVNSHGSSSQHRTTLAPP